MCPNCDNHNYSSRQACNKCQTPKPGSQMFAGASPYGGGYGGGAMMPMAQPMVQWGGGGKGCGGGAVQWGGKGGMGGAPASGGNPNFRQGDWICAACQNHNYSSRETCNKCQGPKAQAPPPPPVNYGVAGMKGGKSYGGGPPRPAPYGGMPHGGAPFGGYGMAMPTNMRPGDWVCPACQNHNYSSRENCNKCQRPKAAPQNYREGDWICAGCQNHNYASRDACNKCQSPKPVAGSFQV